jgi:hypothetical protein
MGICPFFEDLYKREENYPNLKKKLPNFGTFADNLLNFCLNYQKM